MIDKFIVQKSHIVSLFSGFESVNAGFGNLLKTFCEQNEIEYPYKAHNYKMDERMPYSQWLQKLEIINKNYDKEGLGMKISEWVEPNHVGTLAYLAMSCKNILEAFLCFDKYIRLSYDYTSYSTEIRDDIVTIYWNTLTKPNDIADETAISILYMFINKFLNNSFYLKKIHFGRSQPKNIKIYSDFFKCPVYFEKKQTALYFDVSFFKLSINRIDNEIYDIIKDHADKMLNLLPERESFQAIIIKNILISISEGNVSIQNVSKKMNMHTRELQLKLNELDFNYKQLLNEVRKDLAAGYINDIRLSMKDVASLLAYSEQTSFNRAFKAWFGVSPLQYRKNL